jgi:hypothetical protein
MKMTTRIGMVLSGRLGITSTPRASNDYRCSTCRLDLRWSEETASLGVAPFQAPEDNRRSGNDRRMFARGDSI